MSTRARRVVLATSLAVWGAGFACVHVAWAVGWEAGLPADAVPIAERPWFLAYDLLAGFLMYAVAAACVVFALGRETPLLRRATVGCSVLALARGVPALGLDVATGNMTGVGFGADVWFTVAGLAGLAMVRVSRPASPRRTPAPGRRPPAVGAR
ncbi:MAG: hypothetical protein M3237_10985 [Actinomycetota bacterium]|nr:hypothetical protein [Actinomycetota bacterium]